jgi:L-ribulose-5-phosphate 4-epimerase
MTEIGVKFNCNWIKEKPLHTKWIKELNQWRDVLYNSKLIGAYENGIGYGNLSVRFNQQHFIISGTATGNYKQLSAKHYAKVTDYDLTENSLTSLGPIKASAESLTHAAVYEHDSNINAVIHIHHLGLWEKLINKVPTTNESIEYGTTAMAFEIFRLFDETNLSEQKIFVMAGHKEGIVAFGKNLSEAGKIILTELNKYQVDK